jgi:diguanylate cyclase (GGDEF)-like protein
LRLISRNDATLVVGLIAGTVVVFQRPLRSVWEAARAVQERYDVDLLPSLTIFVGVFIFHEARKRQRSRADAAFAAAEAAQARLRSAELERLVAFGQALSNALDLAALQRAWWRHLPAFTGEREFWVLARRNDAWETFAQDTTAPRDPRLETFEAMADVTLSDDGLKESSLGGLVIGQDLCLPMVAAGVVVGVLGVHDGAAIADSHRTALGVATGLIAISVRNVQLLIETREHGLRDHLTGCVNRGFGLEALDRELRLARRSRQPLSILLFDLDHFKTINDELGHLRGDDLLRAVGAQLTRVLRTTDVRCRYGGDEFLIVLPATALAGAQHVAESILKSMRSLAMAAGDRTIPVTISIGVVTAAGDELGLTGLIERADAALYQAKREGRDRSSTGAILPLVAVVPGS